MIRKGIILAGGYGTRLYPATTAISKHMMPIFDKPMIYYPLSTLMQANIRDILIITTNQDASLFEKLLGDGSNWGVKIQYITQKAPNGIAEALIIGENFINNENCALILGDNIFYGSHLEELLINVNNNFSKATIFAYEVSEPARYGVVEFDQNNKVISIEEKPKKPKSNFAVTGLYFYDNQASKLAKTLKPSKRGELEITHLNELYLKQNKLNIVKLNRGYAWLDTGTHESLMEASEFISIIQKRQAIKIACLEEIAYNKNWIKEDDILKIANKLSNNQYGEYLFNIIKNNK